MRLTFEGILPRLSRWFIRTALGYLMAFFVAGTVQSALSSDRVLWPIQVHLLVLGWLTQLIFGVAYWMFPRPAPEASRRSEALGWATYWLLNVGFVLRLTGETIRALGQPNHQLLAAAAVLQLAAGWLFVVNTWPRVKGR